MKKLFIFIIQFVFIFSFASAAKKAKNNQPVILDWQFKSQGEEIPHWVKAAAQSEKKSVVEELDLSQCQVWIINASGEDLESLEFTADTTGIASEVIRTFTLWVREESLYENDFKEKEIQRVMNLVSDGEISGLQKVESFWIKNGYPKAGIKKARKESDYDVKYNYYSVWCMDQLLYDYNFKGILEDCPPLPDE